MSKESGPKDLPTRSSELVPLQNIWYVLDCRMSASTPTCWHAIQPSHRDTIVQLYAILELYYRPFKSKYAPLFNKQSIDRIKADFWKTFSYTTFFYFTRFLLHCFSLETSFNLMYIKCILTNFSNLVCYRYLNSKPRPRLGRQLKACNSTRDKQRVLSVQPQVTAVSKP